jgi:predicted protein tyrosine phosphatase
MILFVCSQGKIRSRTAEVLCLMGCIEARSCGTDDSAIVRVSDGLIREAEVVVCMERRHTTVLQEMNFMHLDLAKVVELGIEDIYEPFDPRLVEKLIDSLGGTLRMASVAIIAGQATRNAMMAECCKPCG